jgi:YD repeat-containing protein
MTKMISVGPMHIPASQLPTLVKLLGAKIVTKEPEFRCCTSDEGCGDIEGCPFDLKLLFSHLAPGESQTVNCNKTGKLISVHRTLAREET